MKYYIAENGQPAGPFELKDLMQHGLTPNSQVWNEKMSGWTRASEVPELMTLMGLPVAAQPGQPVQPVQPQPSPYAPQQPQQSVQPQQPVANPEPSPYAPQQPEAVNTPEKTEVQTPYTSQQQNYEQPVQTNEAQPQPQGYGQQPSPYAQPQYEQPQQPYNGPQQNQQPQYQQPQQFPQRQMPYGQQYVPNVLPPKNWMTESIIFTVLSVLCCCNPFALITGIIAIVNAGKVNGLFQRGDALGAQEGAKQAKMWALITLGLLILGVILSVVLVMVNPELKNAFMEGYENGYNPV